MAEVIRHHVNELMTISCHDNSNKTLLKDDCCALLRIMITMLIPWSIHRISHYLI